MTLVHFSRFGQTGVAVALPVSIDPNEVHLRLPAAVALQLGLQSIDWRWFEGRKVRYVGPVQVEALGRFICCGAIVVGDEVVLGSIVLASLDLRFDLIDGALVANSAIPHSLAVGVRDIS